MDHTDQLRALLSAAATRRTGADGISDLRRLSGGASQEIWAFRAEGGSLPAPLDLILRRAPPGLSAAKRETAIAPALEAELQIRAGRAGVPVASISFILDDTDGLGTGYVMGRVEGETLARKILRDQQFAAIRPQLAGRCGAVLADLHRMKVDDLDGLRLFGARGQIEQYRTIYKGFDDPRPAFDWALQWLLRHPAIDAATPDRRSALPVHGDFRNGNLMIGPDGVRAVLDWELAHLGDGHEDLGWICVNSWRFGEIDHPVGGFGERADLFAAYEAAGGGRVDPERVRFWEAFGTLKWGIMCMISCSAHLTGADRSVERAAIGRRVSETELDLINLIAGEP